MNVRFSKKFQKQLKKCPKKVKDAFVQRLEIFVNDKNNQILRNHALIGGMKGLYSINITGDWRAIYEEYDVDSVEFVAIGTHSQLYK